jgi:hypothetical protein
LRRRRQQWQQITEGNQMKETRKPKKTLDAKLINSATSSAMPPLRQARHDHPHHPPRKQTSHVICHVSSQFIQFATSAPANYSFLPL